MHEPEVCDGYGDYRHMDIRRFHLAKPVRILLLGLLAGVIATTAASMAQSPTTTTVRVQGPATAVPVGQSFTVNIYSDDAVDLGSFEFQYLFDPAIVSATVEDIHLAGFLGSTGRNTGELRLPAAQGSAAGWYGAYSYGGASGPAGSGLLATVAMTAQAAGSSTLATVSTQVTDIDGNPLAVATQSDTVRVTDGPPADQYPIFLPMLLRSGGA